MNEYEQQAQEFLQSCGATLEVIYQYTGKHFADDTEERDIYRFTIKSARGEYSGNFGDSIRNTERRQYASHSAGGCLMSRDERRAKSLGFKVYNSGRLDSKEIAEARKHKPGAYDILACLIHYEPGTHAGFCADFGYDEDSRKGLEVYLSVQKEWEGVRRVFTSEQIEKLAEIQ